MAALDEFGYDQIALALFAITLLSATLLLILEPTAILRDSIHFIGRKMAKATAADGQMKDLKISETKKSKKDGAPKTAAKKPQQPKKKVRTRRLSSLGGDCALTIRQIEGAALIGIDVAKEDDLGAWYQQVITKGQMISYYDVRPHSIS
jgi:hypothetical protein